MLTDEQVAFLGRVRMFPAAMRPQLGKAIHDPELKTWEMAASLHKLGMIELVEQGGSLFVWITGKGAVAYYVTMQERSPTG